MDIHFDPIHETALDWVLNRLRVIGGSINKPYGQLLRERAIEMKCGQNIGIVPTHPHPTICYRTRSITESDRYVRYVAAQVAAGRGEIGFTDKGEMIFHLRLTRDDSRDEQDVQMVGIEEVWLYFNPPADLTDPYSNRWWD